MFARPITLFKMFGFSVRIDISWVVIAVLVTWSLAVGFFPTQYPQKEYPQFSVFTYWLMGIAGMAGLFVSIVFHELCHSLVARAYGLPMKGITLFIFGGVAEMTGEPKSPKAEFLMAIAGPASSIGLALVFYLCSLGARAIQWPVPVTGILGYLAFINMVLVAFNLLPGFPLDGGRVLRSILWYWKDNLHWATKVSASVGSGFGMLLIALGVFSFIMGNFIGGMWWFLIGMFLRNAANMSYQQLIMRDALSGQAVTKFMTKEVVSVRPNTTIEDLVEHYIYKYHYKMYPVVDGQRLLGCVSIEQVKGIPRDDWPWRRVEEIEQACSDKNSISSDQDAMAAMVKMSQQQITRLMVVRDGRIEGMVSLKDMLGFLSMKMELEQNTRAKNGRT